MKVKLVDMKPDYWGAVFALQEEAYGPELLELPEVLYAKVNFTGHMCKVVLDPENDIVLGYLLVHPWKPKDAPALNSLSTDENSEELNYIRYKNLFIHDFALGDTLQGQGTAIPLIQDFLQQAKAKGIKSISLVAVQDSVLFWEKFGFRTEPISKDLSSYGDDAQFMYLEFNDLPN